jgi:hypothetical protein
MGLTLPKWRSQMRSGYTSADPFIEENLAELAKLKKMLNVE